MTDRLLNLIADVQDENYGYSQEIMFCESEDCDYILTYERLFKTDDYEANSFDVSVVQRHEDEFESLDISTGYRVEGPYPLEGLGDVAVHWVSVRVKE